MSEQDRREKYARVLPKLRLDRAVFVSGTPVSVHVAEPMGERCDVLARLIHVQSGRTRAQTEIMLSDETETIPLGKALNIPDGPYEVLLTPPLAQLHGGVPSERRLPCVVAAAPLSVRPYGTQAERDQELIRGFVSRGGATAAIAEALASDSVPPRAAVAELVADGSGTAWAFVAAIAAQSADGLRETAGSAAPPIAAAVLRCLTAGDRGVAALLTRAGTHGFADGAIPDDGDLAAMAALAVLADDDDPLGRLAVAVLDKAMTCLALRSVDGLPAGEGHQSSRHSRLAALSRHAWGVGSYGAAGPGVLALAATGYEVPSPIQAVALDPAEALNIEVHQADDGVVSRVVTWRRGAVLLQVAPDGWRVRLGTDAEIIGTGAEATVGMGVLANGGVPTGAVPLWAFDDWRLTDGRFAASVGADRLELESDAAIAVVPADNGVGHALVGGDAWSCGLRTAGPNAAHGDPADGAPAAVVGDDAHLKTPYGTATFGQTQFELRFGDHGVVLDFGV